MAMWYPGGAQGHRLDPIPPWTESRRPVWGLAQPFADVMKLVFKEIMIPADANGFLFRVAPFLALVPALALWAVIPLRPGACLREYRCRSFVLVGAHLNGSLRHHSGGLGGEF